jgi:CDP-glucose 4,6-dehydratase
VLEPLRGYLTLAERLFTHGADYAEAWNFGPSPEDARSVQWIVERLVAHWGDDASWGKQAGHHPHEANYLKLDISKAGQFLQWQPVLKLETALQWIVDWIRAWHKGSDPRMLTMHQIHQYQSTLSH